MASVTSICVTTDEKESSFDFQLFFMYLPETKLTKVKLKGKCVLSQIKRSLGRFVNLQQLDILETVHDVAILNEICESVKACKELNEINLHVKVFLRCYWA